MLGKTLQSKNQETLGTETLPNAFEKIILKRKNDLLLLNNDNDKSITANHNNITNITNITTNHINKTNNHDDTEFKTYDAEYSSIINELRCFRDGTTFIDFSQNKGILHFI